MSLTRRTRAYAIIAPLMLFVVVTFILPLGMILVNSIYDPVVPNGLPRTVSELETWDGPPTQVPPETVYAALAQDLKQAVEQQKVGSIANRLNIEQSGLRTILTKTATQLRDQNTGPWAPAFEAADPAWSRPEIWGTIRNLSSSTHLLFFLSALDLRQLPDGTVAQQPEDQRIYVKIYLRTLGVASTVTAICMLLGFPLAYLLAHLKEKTANLLLILVLLPLWTSLLVRTTIWMVMLQKEGIVNWALQRLEIITHPIQLIFNQSGVIIAMTYILLPFMILPMYSAMRQIPAHYVNAARSLGASPAIAFFRVYLPQCMAGVGAGVLLVFVLSLGYYITPELIGGSTEQMISYFIADNISRSLNWGLASALAVILLAAVLPLYVVYDLVISRNRFKIQ
jgi:putative spermidine/putrescine transport system permease protein